MLSDIDDVDNLHLGHKRAWGEGSGRPEAWKREKVDRLRGQVEVFSRSSVQLYK